jgi:hypothetical protein
MAKIISVFIICMFMLSLIPSVTADDGQFAQNLTLLKRKPVSSTTAAVSIRSLGTGTLTDYLLKGTSIEIVAKCTGTFSTVYYSIDSGAGVLMTRWGTSDRYYAMWDTSAAALGTHTVKVYTLSSTGAQVAYQTKSVTVTSTYQMYLYYEIDYMQGLQPPQIVLDYWTAWWNSRAVKLTYKLDDVVPYASVVSDLFAYEAQYNDYEFASYGTVNDQGGNVMNSQEKWVLWGSWDTNTGTGGYTYISATKTDLVCGNYIFIAAQMCQDYEADYGIPNYGAQVVVMMHEGAHAIGVAILSRSGGETYDSDYYGIMSYMRAENCGFNNHWYYSTEYWSARNDLY